MIPNTYLKSVKYSFTQDFYSDSIDIEVVTGPQADEEPYLTLSTDRWSIDPKDFDTIPKVLRHLVDLAKKAIPS